MFSSKHVITFPVMTEAEFVLYSSILCLTNRITRPVVVCFSGFESIHVKISLNLKLEKEKMSFIFIKDSHFL